MQIVEAIVTPCISMFRSDSAIVSDQASVGPISFSNSGWTGLVRWVSVPPQLARTKPTVGACIDPPPEFKSGTLDDLIQWDNTTAFHAYI